MTTIAYRAGILAGDGRETLAGEDESYIILRDNCVKVHRLANGSLFGGAHSSEDIERLFTALSKKLPPPKLECIAGLRVDTRGRMWLYEGNIWQSLKGLPYYAIGSGSIFALAAMDAGATAQEAVKIGVRRDPYSGGKITTVRLKRT